MKRLFSILLLAALLFCPSCAAPQEPAPPEESSPPEETAPAGEGLTVADGEGAYYVFVVPSGAAALREQASRMKGEGYAVSGRQLFIRTEGSADPEEKEILLGKTDRPESQTAGEGLGIAEYRITVIGEKIVVAGGSNAAACEGAKRLYQEYFKNAKDRISIPRDLEERGRCEMLSNDFKAGWNPAVFPAENGIELLYQLWLPKNYDPEKSYGCLFFLHSAGVRCDDNSHIYTGEAKFLRNLEKSGYAEEMIVVAPCCPKTAQWVPAKGWKNLKYPFSELEPTPYMTAAWELFETTLASLSVDRSRLYAYGMSMGAFGVYDTLVRHPGIFAGAALAAGAGDADHADRYDTPLWIFHGTADTVVPYESATLMRDALKEKKPDLEVRFTTFEGAGHGIWAATADTGGLFDWLFTKRR